MYVVFLYTFPDIESDAFSSDQYCYIIFLFESRYDSPLKLISKSIILLLLLYYTLYRINV